MRLILFTLTASAAIGLATGGTFREFPSVRLRWWWLALLGVALQFLPLSGAAGTIALLASFASLCVFTAANARAPGFALILAGLALNAIVIGANGGMPVTGHALIASNQAGTRAELVRSGGAKHRLADDETVLLPLGDVIAIGEPIDQAISVGDILVHAGVAWFVIGAMPRRRRVAEARPVP
jgi:hypothetical protein